MSAAKKTIACFGATGGCVGAALACALNEGHYCTALARTPEKLRQFLTVDHNVSLSTIDRYLTIYPGDVKEQADVSKALINPKNENCLVDVILSGIGAYPTVQLSIKRPFPLKDPTICETAIRVIYTALEDLSLSFQSASLSSTPVEKPMLIVISTAGCGRGRGIPGPIYLPYHYFLSSPLADKKRMENLVLGDKGIHVRDFVVMRPLFLTKGEAKGDAHLRVGWEWGVEREDTEPDKEPGPVLGYSVSKTDVGKWTFEKVIVEGGWEGKCVYLTYQ